MGSMCKRVFLFCCMTCSGSSCVLLLSKMDPAHCLFLFYRQRIKSNQIQKLLKEEKEVLDEQGLTLQSQVKAQNQVVRSLEDKERILQNSLAIIEKEQR